MIYLIGTAPPDEWGRYQQGTIDQFMQWIRQQDAYQLDVETTVSKWWCDKRLITLQFGDMWGKDQWVIQWSSLSPLEQDDLGRVLEWQWQLKVIHNAMFELVVLLFHGIRLRNVYCTMLAEMILHCGAEAKEDDVEEDETDSQGGFYSLTELCYRYLCRWLNKTEQMNFGDDILTVSKVLYAAADVVPLGAIRRMQLLEIAAENLEFVAALEMEAVLGYAEMTWTGMGIDPEKWLSNLELAGPVAREAEESLNQELVSEGNPFRKKAIEMGFYDPLDRWIMKWTSHKKKKELVDYYFPFLSDRCSGAVLKKLIRDRDKDDPFSDRRAWEWVDAFAAEDWKKIQTACLEIDREWLLEREFIIPGGQVTINWNSWQQVLPVFQVYKKKMDSVGKKSLGTFYHPIGKKYTEFKEAKKLATTYGAEFLEKHIEPDGKVRTSFNQIMSTGRVSSARPNMQNIPVRDPIGPRYRNAFIPPPGRKVASSDYVSQELVIIAYLSGDPVWDAALRNKQDLHSICAELVFGKRWEKATEPGCAYYALKDGKPAHQKCKCKGHKALREPTKTVDFGLAYGMSKYKLSGDQRITVQEAERIILDFFKTFPKIGSLLTYLGRFGLNRGYIITIAPFFRKRWFPNWKHSRTAIDAHIRDIEYDSVLGHIERESKNTPIQGSSADITKLALVMLYWKIHDELHVADKVQLWMQVHDQNDTIADDSYVEEWSKHLHSTMEEAALYVIPNGLLRADTSISAVWTK